MKESFKNRGKLRRECFEEFNIHKNIKKKYQTTIYTINSSQADSSNSKSVGSTQQQQQKLKTSADGSTNRDPIDKSANSETVRKSVSTKEESSVPKPFVPPIKG